ncbi:hypothetical protein RWH44_13775 [Microbacterium sp. KSW2-29]|uniref:Uncharacterized protein n=1 Tax=Microbacterium phycohabitans TaxID=3075993 RepID=A0ABU3SQI3_9MICO|nr:hypothetical protein [Microbacterium sp. KSW2-29]MDU0346767.1 hypothetical protein [Microbacterium sp. KSW2-29]
MLLDLQVPQASSELVGCERPLGSEIDQAFFLDVELLEFLLQLSSLLRLIREYPFKGGADFSLSGGYGLGGEDDCPKLALERTLKVGDGQVRQVAEAVLAATAEEVLLDLACVILGFGEDEAMFSPRCVASTAMEQATREVVMDAVALCPFCTSIEHLLDPVEQFRRDEWFVASWVDVAFEGHHADVVRVAEYLAQLTS